jgi:hypothetical protein
VQTLVTPNRWSRALGTVLQFPAHFQIRGSDAENRCEIRCIWGARAFGRACAGRGRVDRGHDRATAPKVEAERERAVASMRRRTANGRGVEGASCSRGRA